MRHASLFSGIGGFDLAAEWMGWENVFHCEWNTFGQKVLKYYWPNSECFTDITKSDFTKYANKIDILTGGFPCQPYSTAGKRLGKEDERHLWPEMLRAIREIKPRIVVGENVFGLLSWNGGMVFDEVHTDLEAEGYQVQAVVIPAAAVNAPHGRDRVWFVAYSNSFGNRREFEQSSNSCEQRRSSEANKGKRSKREQQSICDVTSQGDATNTKCSGGIQRFKNLQSKKSDGKRFNSNGSKWDAPNTDSDGQQQCNGKHEKHSSKGGFNALNDIEPNNTQHPKSVRQEYALENGELEGGRSRFTNKRNVWDAFPSQPPICSGNDGFSNRLDGITFSKWRSESIKAYGNAIVPQVAFEIFKAIELTLKNG
jgi:DNA (cytosine-5)-methyltransferase 1